MILRYRCTGRAPVGTPLDDMRRPVQLFFAAADETYVAGLNGWAPTFCPIVEAAQADQVHDGDVLEFTARRLPARDDARCPR